MASVEMQARFMLALHAVVLWVAAFVSIMALAGSKCTCRSNVSQAGARD